MLASAFERGEEESVPAYAGIVVSKPFFLDNNASVGSGWDSLVESKNEAFEEALPSV